MFCTVNGMDGIYKAQAPVGSSISLALLIPDADLFTDRTFTISCDALKGTT